MTRNREDTSARTVVAVALAASVVLAGCIPGAVTGRSHPSGVATIGEWRVGTITADRSDTFSITANQNTVNLSAPASNTGGNLRVAGARHAVAESVDHHACITWSGPNVGAVQPGVALRTSMAGNRTRAIVVSNNIYFGARGIWNVHYMDSAMPGGFTQIASLPIMGSALPTAPPPWRVCAKVEGDELTVKVWPVRNEAEPNWSDPVRARSVRLAPEHVHPGRPGWYTAHLRRNESTALDDVTGYTVATYQASLQWVDQLSSAMIGGILPQSTRMTYADMTANGEAARVIDLLRGDMARRTRSVCAIFTTTLGRCGTHSVALLDQRGADGLAAAHFTSPEFSSSRDDRQFVIDQFLRVLRREPSAASIQWHLNHIAANGRNANVRNVWRTQEHGNWRAHDAFVAFHGRPPSAAEQSAVAAHWAAAGWDPIVLIGYASLLTAPAG